MLLADGMRRPEVPFFVAIYQEAWPDYEQTLLAAIRDNFAARARYPGRRSARVFQRLNDPTRLLTIGEWENQAAYLSLRQSPDFEETVATCGPPPTIEYLERLHLFHRMSQRPAVVTCSTIDAPIERMAQVEACVRGPLHDPTMNPGLISSELYRPLGNPRRLVVVHSWRALADLERFRATDSPGLEHELTRLGGTVARFTGEIAAEFSIPERVSDP
jgi:quinol monooxygenase YgiN